MGTDIHWFVERRENTSSAWVLLDGAVPFLEVDESPLVYRVRNYELFGALAGVRGKTPRELPVRGLPVDVSPIVAACAKTHEYYCRGHGFASLPELRVFFGRDFSDCVLESVVGEMERSANGGEIRAVFWFDR